MDPSRTSVSSNNHLNPPCPQRGQGGKSTSSPKTPSRQRNKTPPQKRLPVNFGSPFWCVLMLMPLSWAHVWSRPTLLRRGKLVKLALRIVLQFPLQFLSFMYTQPPHSQRHLDHPISMWPLVTCHHHTPSHQRNPILVHQLDIPQMALLCTKLPSFSIISRLPKAIPIPIRSSTCWVLFHPWRRYLHSSSILRWWHTGLSADDTEHNWQFQWY